MKNLTLQQAADAKSDAEQLLNDSVKEAMTQYHASTGLFVTGIAVTIMKHSRVVARGEKQDESVLMGVTITTNAADLL